MTKASYIKTSGYILGLAGSLHLLRVFLGWELVLGGYLVPVWLSLLGGLFLWWLAYTSMKL
jgi:hypothetical protein